MHQRFPLRVRGRPFGCLVAHFDAFAFVFEAFDMLSASLSLYLALSPFINGDHSSEFGLFVVGYALCEKMRNKTRAGSSYSSSTGIDVNGFAKLALHY